MGAYLTWQTQFALMADMFSKAQRSQVMAAVRSVGNRATELEMVRLLRAAKIKGWRRHLALPGHPDFVFLRQRLVIFVDGCFWHGCRLHCRMPQHNRQYWQRKITGNVIRDRKTRRQLRYGGWRVLRIWSHSLKSPKIVLRRISSQLSRADKFCNIQRNKDERSPKNSC